MDDGEQLSCLTAWSLHSGPPAAKRTETRHAGHGRRGGDRMDAARERGRPMIDTDAGGAGVVTGVAVSADGLAAEQAIAGLERQAAALASVHARVRRALATAPSTAAHDWRGFAQQFYD